jgi:hypothetical protein
MAHLKLACKYASTTLVACFRTLAIASARPPASTIVPSTIIDTLKHPLCPCRNYYAFGPSTTVPNVITLLLY